MTENAFENQAVCKSYKKAVSIHNIITDYMENTIFFLSEVFFLLKNRKKLCIKPLLYIAAVIFLLFWALRTVDRRLMPTAAELADRYAAAYINSEIDSVTSDIISDMGLVYTDFYDISETDGEISSISVNSILVNEICQKTASGLSDALRSPDIKKIPVPLGLVTGIRFFSGMGPMINIHIMPAGSAVADYETALSESGINRVNYKIYLNIKTSVNIISPLSSSPLEISRKYMLVDTVFSGAVPRVYFDSDKAYKGADETAEKAADSVSNENNEKNKKPPRGL